jgi:hypothetical protein
MCVYTLNRARGVLDTFRVTCQENETLLDSNVREEERWRISCNVFYDKTDATYVQHRMKYGTVGRKRIRDDAGKKSAKRLQLGSAVLKLQDRMADILSM